MILAAFALMTLGMVGCDRNDDTTDNATNQPDPATVGFDENGASNAVFSVAENKTVHFSRGNLQYQASTGTWRFAEHQYNIIGAGNENISETYNGWIDLFGWGTSGWDSGVSGRSYQPWETSTDDRTYCPGNNAQNDLTGEYANADWGVYNAISNGGNQAGMWRTLTRDEWKYLLFTRNASTVSGIANARYARATINGSVNGLMIFPDSFTMPAGISVLGSSINGYSSFTDNTYTTQQWSKLEANGAIFLPVTDERDGTRMPGYMNGYYWSSTGYYQYGGYAQSQYKAYCIYFDNEGYLGVTESWRARGTAVRLVRD